MLFTDNFVYVHQPKTGGTSVTSALLRLFGIRWNALARARLATLGALVGRHPRYGTFIFHRNKHGTSAEVPPEHRGKPILATVRNPFDHYVSEYEFGWWKRDEYLPLYRELPGWRERYAPRFPDLDFEEYVMLANAAFGREDGGGGEHGVGLLSRQFARYYAREPRMLLAAVDAGAERWPELLHEVHFVRTEALNAGLHTFLLERGYAEQDLAFLPGMGRVLPGGRGRDAAQRWESYYSPELKRRVRERERLLFRMFPEWDG